MSNTTCSVLLTYRSGRTGRLQAAYCGGVRVGYVEERAHDRWLWQLSIALGPEPKVGKEDDEVSAKAALAEAFDHWLALAGLMQKERVR